MKSNEVDMKKEIREMAEKFLNTYKYIHFVKIENKPKTTVWSCRNNRSEAELGIVKYYPPWRQYCFFPEFDTVFNVGCLEDINHFIGQLR